MALYLGRDKININWDGTRHHLNLYTTMSIAEDIESLSSDNYTLKDLDEDITTKEGEV